jgi:lipoprotein-releasing system permease protein
MKVIYNIDAVSKIVEEKALLQNGEIQTIVYLKGVDENYSRLLRC